MKEKELTVAEAAKIAGKSLVTIRSWIRDFGIGRKIAGRWVVHKSKLDLILNGSITYENQGRPRNED